MEPLDLFVRPLRSLLGVSEREVITHSPLHEAGELDDRLEEAVRSIHRAADSMERHVEVVESLATSVPALTDSVNALVRELGGLLGVLAPLGAAEHEVSRLEHLFGRRRAERQARPPEPPAPTEPQPPQPPAPEQ
jgi:hypothetical protein